MRDGRENYKCQIQTNYPRKSEIKSEPEWGGEGGGIRLGSEGLIHFHISRGKRSRRLHPESASFTTSLQKVERVNPDGSTVQ